MRKNKSQAILDFIIILGILMALTVGFVRIWVWFNANIAKRNVDYQNTRLSAGTADDTHLTTVAYNDDTLPINDDWVFKGAPSGTVGTPLPTSNLTITDPTTEGGVDPLDKICTNAQTTAANLRSQAADMDDQADQMEDFISLGDEWYKPLYLVFRIMDIDVDSYEDAIDDLREGADDTREQADYLEDQACNAETADPYPQF